MVGEAAVEFAVQHVQNQWKTLEDGRHDQATHAVGDVRHDAQRPQTRHVHETADVAGIGVEQVDPVTAPARPGVRIGAGGKHHLPHPEQVSLAAERGEPPPGTP